MKKLTLILSTSILLSACISDDSNKSASDTKKVEEKEVVSNKEKNKHTKEDRKKEKDLSNKDDNNLTEVNGVSHYNIPNILSDSFEESIKRNTFKIGDFGLLKETNKDPYTSLKIDSSESRDGTAVYDNFSFELKNGTGPKVDGNNYPVHSITLNVEEQGVKIDYLVDKWDIADNLAFLGGTADIYNFDSTYATFKYDEQSRVIYEITITEGKFSEGAAPGDLEDTNTSNIDETTSIDVLDSDTSYQILSNTFNLNGIHVNDEITKEEVVELLGEPNEDLNDTLHYDNYSVSIYNDKVEEILIRVAPQIVSIDELKESWDIPFEETGDNSMSVTIYDGNKNNNYHVEVAHTYGGANGEDNVQTIHIFSGDY
ncbi:hypothetical protein [Macrococcoides canis]|uniref:hypothetical protein n=1 Tax=Macrococcoides canis TaxID=1855823 RepID=UPI00165E4E12|nr:hypothetical protein [Macrococcus canis]QNR09109.1 hypothetical protein GL258_12550 [Macrococcus canis]